MSGINQPRAEQMQPSRKKKGVKLFSICWEGREPERFRFLSELPYVLQVQGGCGFVKWKMVLKRITRWLCSFMSPFLNSCVKNTNAKVSNPQDDMLYNTNILGKHL